VQFTGPVDDTLLRRYYAGCDVLVVPSRFESFGLILVEAMMFAKPVVATDVGGMKEIVLHGETGFLVPPDNVAGLTSALAAFVRSARLRRDMGEHGRKRYEEHFALSGMVRGAEAYYRELISSAPVPALRSAPAASAEFASTT
jgi:hypothetical protein